MELWIRSQDKMTLIKPNNINVCDYFIYVNEFNVGRYETQTRIIEILDEIQTIIKQNDFTHRVYEMPKK